MNRNLVNRLFNGHPCCLCNLVVSKGGPPDLNVNFMPCDDLMSCWNAHKFTDVEGTFSHGWGVQSSSKLSSELETMYFQTKIAYLLEDIWLFPKTEGVFASINVLNYKDIY